MFVASIAHILAFPVAPYKQDQLSNWWSNIRHAANVSDFNSEVKTHYDHFYSKFRGAFRKNGTTSREAENNNDIEPDENSKLLGDADEYGPYTNPQVANSNSTDSITVII